MNLMISKTHINRVKVWTLCAIFFVLPMNASYIYTLSGLLLVLWIAEGGVREKLIKIRSSRLCLACVVYFFVYVLAMLWTENVAAGWRMVSRQIPFLIFPLYFSSAEIEKKESYISSFICGVCFCAVLAHYNFLQLHFFPDWPRGIKVYKGPLDTAPFVDWIMYVPILALGLYFSLRRVLMEKKPRARVLYLFVSLLLLSNLSFSGGRAGMVMFVALLMALIFERLKTPLKAVLVCIVTIPLLFFLAYFSVNSFASRVDRGLTDIREFEHNPRTSLGERMVYWTTTFDLVKRNPVLGVGSGDLQDEYAKIKPEKWSMTADSYNPHNQYLMTAATTGMLGLFTLFYIFYLIIIHGDAKTKSVLFGFMVLFLFESYLWRSNTSLTFFIMMAALVNKEKVDLKMTRNLG